MQFQVKPFILLTLYAVLSIHMFSHHIPMKTGEHSSRNVVAETIVKMLVWIIHGIMILYLKILYKTYSFDEQLQKSVGKLFLS